MPVDSAVLSGLSLFGHTFECIPDDVEILVAAGKVQRYRISQTDDQRAHGLLLDDGSADDGDLDTLGGLA